MTSHNSITSSLIKLAFIFMISTGIVILILDNYLPKSRHLKFPRSIHDVKLLHETLVGHGGGGFHVVICFVTVFIYLQSFAIPGSVMLSVLGGALWGSWKALFLVCLCSSTGATICNFLSFYFGRVISKKVTPFLPNWFINVASPHLSVDASVFFWATLIGVGPLSFIHVKSGETIHMLSETDNFTFFTFQNVLTMGLIAVAALIPVIFKEVFEKKFKNDNVIDKAGSQNWNKVK
ncbi:14943_t:CDS:2 [Acaulospora morrowiae]|uniref:14943_t:CDS:1 n=1 Tax=Acaulospora morrowiae TaxID=94023 RepID=A0A9N9DM42_9GLOM|nr:14943_t:CDS:2 [Acaulospora morrowiae]